MPLGRPRPLGRLSASRGRPRDVLVTAVGDAMTSAPTTSKTGTASASSSSRRVSHPVTSASRVSLPGWRSTAVTVGAVSVGDLDQVDAHAAGDVDDRDPMAGWDGIEVGCSGMQLRARSAMRSVEPPSGWTAMRPRAARMAVRGTRARAARQMEVGHDPVAGVQVAVGRADLGDPLGDFLTGEQRQDRARPLGPPGADVRPPAGRRFRGRRRPRGPVRAVTTGSPPRGVLRACRDSPDSSRLGHR